MSIKNSIGSIKNYTPHYKLIIPEFDIATWHDYMEKNFRNIDALFYNLFGINDYSGEWTQLTQYTTGQVLFIGEDLNSEGEETEYSGRLVKVLQDHTTDNSEYFNIYYTLHPEYYELFADASTAQLYAQQAQQSATNAKQSETKAKESEINSANSEQTATQKATEAKGSAQTAQQIVDDFENNVNSYTESFNNNAENKLNTYNANDLTKTEAFNTNYDTKLSTFNTNATEKTEIVNTKAQEAQTSATNAANSEQNAAQSAEEAAASAASVDATTIKKIAYENIRTVNCSGETTINLQDTDEVINLIIQENSDIIFNTSQLNFSKYFYTVQIVFTFNTAKTITLSSNLSSIKYINDIVPDFSDARQHWLVLRINNAKNFLLISDAGIG